MEQKRTKKQDTLTTDKNAVSVSAVASSDDQKMTIALYIFLDILIDVVENMGSHINKQDERLHKQEERSS